MKLSDLKNLISSESSESVLVREATGSFLIKVAGAAITLAVQVLLARTLGADQFGIFAYVITWILVLLLIGKLGIDTAFLKYVSEYRANEQWGLLKGVLKDGHRIVLLSSFSISIICTIILLLLKEIISEDLRITGLIACAVIPLMAVVQIRQAVVRSMQQVMKAILPEFIIQPALLGIIATIFWYVTKRITAAEAMVFNLIAFLIGFAVLTYWMNRSLSHEIRKAPQEKRTKEWISVALPLLMMSGFNLINSKADIIMVGFFRGTTDAGYYFAAVRLATFLTWGLIAVNLIAAPLISQLYSQKKFAELQRIASLSALGIAIFTFPAAILMLALGRFFLGWYGDEFVSAYFPLVLLTLGQCVNALAGSVGYLMTMTKYQKQAAVIVGSTAFINIILNVILIPRMGLTGAATATMISTIMWNLTMYLLVRKNLKIDPSVIGLFKKFK